MKQIIEIIFSIFLNKKKIDKELKSEKKNEWELIDWSDPTAKVSKYFTVKETLWLNSDKIMAVPSEDQKKAIWQMAQKMDIVREFIGKPCIVTSWLRPVEYNIKIGGSKNSKHVKGIATDFVVKDMDCELVRQALLPKLKEWNLRMEDNAHINGGNWIHLDMGKVKWKRFFKP
jgi:hypothetical protein